MAVAAAGGAFIPVTGAGIGSIVSTNIAMLVQICVAFGMNMTIGTAAAVATAAVMAQGISYGARIAIGELLKLVPGVGSAAGGMIEAGIASSSTYAIGMAFTEYLANFNLAHNRLPTIDELQEGFTLAWKNNPNKRIPLPKP